MGAAISIPRILKEMDGVFGCKIVHTENENGEKITSFQKKDFIDWVLDIIFNLESHTVTREKTVAALGEIAEKIEGAESGDFKSLVEKYASSDVKIDFKEVKNVLAQSLSWEFSPSVFSRDAGAQGDLTLLDAYKDVHIKNFKKCICLEGDAIPLTPDSDFTKVSDVNIKGFCEALASFPEQHELPVKYREPISHYGNRQTEIRVQLAAYELLKEKGDPQDQEDNTYIHQLKCGLIQVSKKEINVSRECGETEYEGIYHSKVEQIMLNKPGEDNAYEVEILLSHDGKVSDANIAGLSKALLKIDLSEKLKIDASISKQKENGAPMPAYERINFEFFIPEEAVEEKSDILLRINDARIECRTRYFDDIAHASNNQVQP